MDQKELTDRLEGIAASGDFAAKSAELADEWAQSAESFEAVEPVLRFMELHPALDFGTPGPLVHFVEGFYRRGYEQKLIESINRKPTGHTVWMLNRIINGTKEAGEKQRLVGILRAAKDNPLSDANTCELAARFLTRLSS